MDFTNIKCISQQCKGKNITMNGAGGSFGGRISYACVKCPECETKIMIVPINKNYQYNISATTKEERIEEAIKKEIEKNTLELAEKIARIKEGDY